MLLSILLNTKIQYHYPYQSLIFHRLVGINKTIQHISI